MKRELVVRERRHTLHFLGSIRAFAPVFIDTEIDMSRILEHRAAARHVGRRYSIVTYVLHESARALSAHPAANAAFGGRIWPKVIRYDRVSGKIALDKMLNGHRLVLSAIIPDLHQASLDEIQRQVDYYRDGDPAQLAEFAPTRMLQRLPFPLGSLVFRLGARPLRRRFSVFGTFAVTSLGHRPVDGFYSVGGTTITVGLGRIADRPVARDGEVIVVPVMRLSLAFDHRVVDGAEAADVLADIKSNLEKFSDLPGSASEMAVAPTQRQAAPGRPSSNRATRS